MNSNYSINNNLARTASRADARDCHRGTCQTPHLPISKSLYRKPVRHTQRGSAPKARLRSTAPNHMVCANFPSPCVELDLKSIVEKLGGGDVAQEDRRDFAWQSFSISPYQTVILDEKSSILIVLCLGNLRFCKHA
jgi:hypothetical protein